MVTHQTPEVFLGLDVGKTKHWACAITADGKVVWNKALPNDETKLIDVYTRLQKLGSLLVVVDQPGHFCALGDQTRDNVRFSHIKSIRVL